MSHVKKKWLVTSGCQSGRSCCRVRAFQATWLWCIYLQWSRDVQGKKKKSYMQLVISSNNILKFASLFHRFFFIYATIGCSCRSFFFNNAVAVYILTKASMIRVWYIWAGEKSKCCCTITAQDSPGPSQSLWFSEMGAVASALPSRQPW